MQSSKDSTMPHIRLMSSSHLTNKNWSSTWPPTISGWPAIFTPANSFLNRRSKSIARGQPCLISLSKTIGLPNVPLSISQASEVSYSVCTHRMVAGGNRKPPMPCTGTLCRHDRMLPQNQDLLLLPGVVPP